MRALPALLAATLLAVPAFAQEPAPAVPAPAPATPAAAPAAPAAPAATTTPAPATPPTETPAPEAPPATTGMLSVTSSPSGKVMLDDKDTGLVTPVTDLAVAAGTHTVKVVADDGRSQSTEFTLEAGGSLSLNLALPEAEAKPAATDAPKVDEKPAEATPAEAAPAVDDWTWMTVSGWSGLGLGTIGLLSGAVVLTTPTDPQQGPLGFGLFGAGVGMVLGGAVLLYLDNELSESTPATAPAVAPAR
jgi:hypothetical protein